MIFLSKTILKNGFFILKYPILAVLDLGGNPEFPDFSKYSFITSATV